jgi:UDP-glucoronosyl and UDP-glucosyl transferase
MRILVTSTPGMGHLNSLLPLMTALQRGGHDLLVVTAAESCEYVIRHGFTVQAGGMSSAERRIPFQPRMPEVLALPPRKRRALYFTGFFADVAAPAMRGDLMHVFDEFRPEIVIHELGELAAAPMAQARGIPHVTVAFSGALPDWSQTPVMESLVPIWSAEGLAAPTMNDINGDLYLHPFPPSFGQEPAARVMSRMRAETVDAVYGDPPDWLEGLGMTRPLVYLTSGTEPAAAMAPWAAAIEALGSIDVDAVATIGPHLDEAVLGDVPSNVRVERFVPQRFVLDRATIVMSHAGAGSLLGAAGRGLAQVLCPLVADQWENADAATGAGVAITCELDRRSAGDITTALQSLLDDDRFRDAASNVAAEIHSMPAPNDHVATIEALVGNSR